MAEFFRLNFWRAGWCSIDDARKLLTHFAVANPETTALVEPTDEALDRLIADVLPGSLMSRVGYRMIIRAALRTFPQVQKVEASDEAIERFRDEWGARNGHDFKRTDYLKAALAKFTPPKAGTLLSDQDIDCIARAYLGVVAEVHALNILDFARAIEAKVRGTA